MIQKISYAIVAVILLATIVIIFRPKVIPVETSEIQRKLFIETLSAQGKIQSKEKRTVYAYASGKIENIFLNLGDLVKKNQVVTRLEWDYSVPIKSPIDGVISKIYRDSAGPVQRGDPIFEVSSLSDLEIIAEVLTPDAVRIPPDSPAEIKNWGGDSVLKAKVSQVSRAGSTKISALGVEEERTEVHLEFEEVPKELVERFGSNYHVDVDFTISKLENVMTVPLGALFRNGESWAVYVEKDNRARIRDVQISKRNESEALLISGLAEGEKVILYPGDKVRDKTRVKISTRAL